MGTMEWIFEPLGLRPRRRRSRAPATVPLYIREPMAPPAYPRRIRRR